MKARYGLAALAGLMMSAGFSPWEIAGAAWAGPGLLLFAALGERGWRAFRIGFFGGTVHFLSSIYWLLAMPFAWHGIPIAPGLAWIALSGYCGIYFGLWVWFSWRIFPVKPGGAELSLTQRADEFLAAAGLRRVQWALVCGAGWVGLELMRGLFLSGFPWNYLGNSQSAMLPLIQMASVTGVYGVSFLMAWFSVAIASALVGLWRKPSTISIWSQAFLPLLAVACDGAYGMLKVGDRIPKPEREIKVALIQPSIPQTLIWDPKENTNGFLKVLELSRKALAEKPRLILWPESALPDYGPQDEATVGELIRRSIRELLADHSAWLILCGDSEEALPSGEEAAYNASLLIDPEAHLQATYHKRRLVIFGEYIPLVRWLPFLKILTPIGSGFTAGDRAVPFDLTGLSARTSVLICFEDMFPQEAREHVDGDTDFLINLTNDGWFGAGAEQKQQAAGAVFRAVENGVPLLRCSNNGLTCWIDSAGRLREYLHQGNDIYGPGYLTPAIPLRSAENRGMTYYTRHGDVFAWTCSGIAGWVLLLSFRRSQWVGRDPVEI